MVLVAIFLVACTRNAPTATHSPAPSPSAGVIAWTDCGAGFQCGTLQVPLDYSRPEGRTISLAVVRTQAKDKAARVGSLLVNPGGPGESGIEYLRADISSLKNLNQRFDLVAWDPRGVAGSTPVTCVDGPQLDAYLSIDSVLDDPQEKQDAMQADKDFAAGCQRRSGDLLPFMDSASTARDMDQIRASLGDAKLTYLGFSYGTYIGQWYAHLFPTHVRALSLDGVVDPTVSANDSLLSQVVGFEQNLQAFLADCKARSTCLFGQNGDPGTKLTSLMSRLDTAPLKVGARQLTRSLALTVTGAPPILLVGGTNDPATPYAESLSVNKQIDGSILLTRRGNGHTSYDSSACAHAAEDAYLIDLKLPAGGTVCSS